MWVGDGLAHVERNQDIEKVTGGVLVLYQELVPWRIAGCCTTGSKGGPVPAGIREPKFPDCISDRIE